MACQLQLADNTIYQVTRCGESSNNNLWIDGLDMTLVEAVAIFSDPTKSSHIVAYGNVEHDGYTKLIHVSLSNEELIKVALKKEA